MAGNKPFSFKDMLEDYVKDPESADREALIRRWQTDTRYKPYCAACIASRRLFVRGLDRIKRGDKVRGGEDVRRSIKNASIKNAILDVFKNAIPDVFK